MRLLAIALLLAAPLPAEETWVQWLLRVTGVSATSRGLRGDEDLAGEIWVAKLDAGVRVQWTTGGGYRSPIFSADGESILAIRDGALVRIPAAREEAGDLGIEVGAARLVAVHREDRDLIVIVKRSAELGVVSLATGEYAPAPTQHEDAKELWEWASALGGVEVFHRRLDGDPDLNVFVQRGQQERRSISRCKDADCGQPAFSPDGSRVAYVKQPK